MLTLCQTLCWTPSHVISFNTHYNPEGRYYWPHFTNENTEVLRGQVILGNIALTLPVRHCVVCFLPFIIAFDSNNNPMS